MNAGSWRGLVLAGACLLGLIGAGQSLAEEREHGGPGPGHIERDGRGQVLDNRFNHGHYYPPRGTVVRELPGGYRPYMFGGSRFFFYGGIWYAPGPGGFLVTRPPIGLYVNVLPPFYTTLWFGGVPFYYANDVYYQWNAAQNGYVVAAPPPGADQPGAPEAAPPPPAADDFYVYPRNGQTQEQQAADRYECHNWAKSQTGFDPTQPAGGAPGGDNGAPRGQQYQRAITACLEARGYSVK